MGRATLEIGNGRGRGDAVAHHVGQVLGNGPRGDDEVWPGEAVRQVLQDISNEDVERGLERELMIRRGVVGRGWEEGGQKEWTRAEQYITQATKVADCWPRLAALFRRLAQHYEIDASERDDVAELRRTTSRARVRRPQRDGPELGDELGHLSFCQARRRSAPRRRRGAVHHRRAP
jgi:hypothetical protein